MPVSENFEVKTNAPTPVIDAGATQVLNGIYSFLQKQSAELSAVRKEQAQRDKEAKSRDQRNEANNRAVQNALTEMSKSQAKGATASTAAASNNRAVEAALKDILRGQRSADVRDMADDRRNRAVNNALFGKIDKTAGAIGTLQDTLKNMLKNIADIIGNMAKESLRSYDDNTKSLRKLFLTSDQIKADLLKGDKAKETLEKYNIKVNSGETKNIITALREAGADTSKLSEEQIAAITMMNKTMGTDVKTALALTASSKDPTKLIAMAVRSADVTGKAATADLLAKTTEPWFDQFAKQVGGNEIALLKFQSVAKQLDSALGMYGLSEKTQSDILEQMAKISSGQLEGVDQDKLIDLLALSPGDISDPEKLMAGIQKAIESGNADNLRALTAAGMSKDLVSSLLKAQAAAKEGNYVKKDIRSDQDNLEGINQAVKGGKVGGAIDSFMTGINTMTGGIFSNLAVDLNEMFGDNVSMESVVSSGFKMVIGILGAMLASKIFKGPMDLLKKGLGSALTGAGAAGAKAAGKGAAAAGAGAQAAGKTGGIIAKIGSAISKIAGPFTKVFPMLSKVAGVVFKFLGPVGWVFTALKAGFSAGKWLVKTLFPGVYLTMQKAGGYIGALKEIGGFIKDKFMEFYTGSIQPLVAQISQMYNDHIKPLVETVGGILADVVTNIWDGTMWFFSEKLPSLFGQVIDLGSSILDLFSAVGTLLSSGFDVIGAYVNIAIKTIENVPTLICGKLQEIWYGLKATLYEKIADIIDWLDGPGVSKEQETMRAAAKEARSNEADAVTKQEDALKQIAEAVREKDEAIETFKNNASAVADAAKAVADNAGKVGDVDVTYEEYHKKKEEERDRDRKELEAWEKKNAAKSNGLLDQIANNTKPEEQMDIFQAAGLSGMRDGGIVSSATPALVGEAGREAVLPLTRPSELKKVLSGLSASDKGKLIKSLLSGDSTTVASLMASAVGPQLPSAANGVPGDDPATINKILGFAGPYRDMVYERMLHGWKGKTKDGFKQRKKWFDEALANAANQEGRDLIRGTYAERALDYGVSELGKPYILRSLGKIGYVCNELVNACVQKSGFDMKKFRVHGVKATFANIRKGKYSGEEYPNFRIRDDLTPETAIPGMVFFQDARKNQEGGFQPGHIGLVYYGHQKLHAAGGSANYTKEGFLPNWQTPCRGVTVTPFDGSNYVIGEFPGMFEQASGEWKPHANSPVPFGPGMSDAALSRSVEANMSSVEDAGLLSNEQISSVLANASGADAKLAASYAAEAAKLMNGSNKEEIIAILTEIARTIRGIATSKKPLMSVNRPAISTY